MRCNDALPAAGPSRAAGGGRAQLDAMILKASILNGA
jgi:hypothetical protein